MKIGDYVAISGCGWDNICKGCTNSCSIYVQGSIIQGTVVEIGKQIGDMTKIFVKPVLEEIILPSRLKWVKPLRKEPDDINLVIF